MKQQGKPSYYLWGFIGLMLFSFSVASAWAADPKQGGKLYSKNCRTCHGDNGVPRMPGLPDFTRIDALMRSDNDLLQFIRTGSGMMPAYRGLLTDGEILDVIAYLRTFSR